MLCKKCGAQIDDNAVECEFCGEKFDVQPVEEETIELTPTPVEEQRSTHEIFEENKQRRKSQTEKIIDEKQQQLSQINERRELKRKREQRNKVILIVVICIVVAVAAIVGAYLIKSNMDADINPVPTGTPVATLSPTPMASQTPGPQDATPSPTPVADNTTVNTNQGTNQGGAVSNNSGTVVTPTKKPSTATPNTTNNASSTPAQSTNSASRKGTGASSYKTPSITSGITNSKLTSTLAVGGVIWVDDYTQKTIMSFEANGKTYYAYVSQGSQTSQVNGKYMTLTATPTGETCAGSTIYEISSLTYYDADGYIVPDSGIRYLTKNDLSKLSKKELGIARNEIYARHGRSFKTKEYSDYFKSKSWYKENPKYNYNNEAVNLNKIEIKNVDLILSLEN